LLLALSYRDGLGDLQKFCEIAEQALAHKTTLIDTGQIHAFLFNAYLERSKNHPQFLEKGADHLYAAFQEKAPIQSSNLLWLADFYYHQWVETAPSPSSLALAERTALILEHEIPSELKEETLFLEPAICKLAKAYGILNRKEEQISLLERIAKQ